jgi:hypothetical protein
MPSFPTIKAYGTVNVLSQLPYGETATFPIVQNVLPCGKAYGINYRGDPIEHMLFSVRWNVMERAELTILEDFYMEMGGNLGYFDFPDDDGTVWPKCRFHGEGLKIEYVGVNQYNVEVLIKSILTG